MEVFVGHANIVHESLTAGPGEDMVDGFVDLLFGQNPVLELNLLGLGLRALEVLLHVDEFLQLSERKAEPLYVLLAHEHSLLAKRRQSHDLLDIFKLESEEALGHFVVGERFVFSYRVVGVLKHGLPVFEQLNFLLGRLRQLGSEGPALSHVLVNGLHSILLLELPQHAGPCHRRHSLV